MPDPDGIYARLEAGQSVGLNEFASQRVIAGTPDDCIAQIQSWQAETGCDYLHLILNTQIGNEAEYEAHKKMLELFRDEIIPAV
jgi:alkanesulfonate monooxygenase SsuD/methylene tetrahydromethanopterin reductase-like flavin-dependent oxidoreductase (luciferase family)